MGSRAFPVPFLCFMTLQHWHIFGSQLGWSMAVAAGLPGVDSSSMVGSLLSWLGVLLLQLVC